MRIFITTPTPWPCSFGFHYRYGPSKIVLHKLAVRGSLVSTVEINLQTCIACHISIIQCCNAAIPLSLFVGFVSVCTPMAAGSSDRGLFGILGTELNTEANWVDEN